MKRSLALTLSLLTLLFGAAFAQKTPADTQIKNTAQASYVDSSGQAQTAQSNEVVTVVQKVYSLTITPNALDGQNRPTSDETAVAQFGQSQTGLLEAELFFDYVVTNTSNTKAGEADLVNLLGVQGKFDDFDFTVLELYQVANPGDRPANGAPTISSVTLGADQEAYIVVKVKIPNQSGADNNEVGNLNLEGAFNAARAVGDADNWAQVLAKTPPDVTLQKTASKTNVVPGDTITYTLSGENLGGTAAYALPNVVTVDGAARTGLLVTDVLPTGLSYTGTATGAAMAGTAVVLYSTDGGVTWTATRPASGVNALGLLVEGAGQFFSAGASYSLSFSAQVPANAGASSAYQNAATLRYDANGDGDALDGEETFTTPPVTSTVGAVYGAAVGPQGEPSAAETGGDTLTATGVTYEDPDNGKVWTFSFSGSHSAGTDAQTVTSTVYTGDTVAFLNTIKNPGNATDTYTLTVTNSEGYAVTLFEDDGLTPLTTPAVSVAAGGTANVVVKVNVPVGGVANTTTLTAASQNDPGSQADVTLDEIPSPQTGYSVDLAANSDGVKGNESGDNDPADDNPAAVTTNPGTTLSFPLELTNTGAQADSFVMSAALPAGWSVVYRIDSNCDGVANGAQETNSGTVNAGETVCYVATVSVPAGASPAAYPLAFSITSDTDPASSADTVSTTVTVREVTDFSFTPSYDNIEQPGQNVTYSGQVTYTHTLTNSGNTAATVNIPARTSPNGWTYEYSVGGGAYVSSISNLNLPAGSSQSLTVRVTVPAPTPFDDRVGESETATVTATASYASGSSASDSVTDVTTVVGGSLNLLKTAVTFDGAQPAPTACSSTLNRVDRNGNGVQGDDANPGDFLCYTIVAENKGNGALERMVVSDALNGFTDFVSVSAAGAGYGTGSGVLYSNNNTTWSASLPSLAAGGTVYVAVNTNGDNTITDADTMPQAAKLTVTFVVKVK